MRRRARRKDGACVGTPATAVASPSCTRSTARQAQHQPGPPRSHTARGHTGRDARAAGRCAQAPGACSCAAGCTQLMHMHAHRRRRSRRSRRGCGRQRHRAPPSPRRPSRAAPPQPAGACRIAAVCWHTQPCPPPARCLTWAEGTVACAAPPTSPPASPPRAAGFPAAPASSYSAPSLLCTDPILVPHRPAALAAVLRQLCRCWLAATRHVCERARGPGCGLDGCAHAARQATCSQAGSKI